MSSAPSEDGRVAAGRLHRQQQGEAEHGNAACTQSRSLMTLIK